MRRLLAPAPPAVQVNIAEKQVNVGNGGLPAQERMAP